MSVDFNSLAKQFCEFYYQTFDTDRTQLGNLYRDHSMLTFTGTQLQGTQAIVEKLVNLPFGQVQHKISDIDAQPASAQGGDVIVLVTGELCVDGDNPLPYAQVFHLIPEGNSYYVFNDIFRLNA